MLDKLDENYSERRIVSSAFEKMSEIDRSQIIASIKMYINDHAINGHKMRVNLRVMNCRRLRVVGNSKAPVTIKNNPIQGEQR